MGLRRCNTRSFSVATLERTLQPSAVPGSAGVRRRRHTDRNAGRLRERLCHDSRLHRVALCHDSRLHRVTLCHESRLHRVTLCHESRLHRVTLR